MHESLPNHPKGFVSWIWISHPRIGGGGGSGSGVDAPELGQGLVQGLARMGREEAFADRTCVTKQGSKTVTLVFKPSALNCRDVIFFCRRGWMLRWDLMKITMGILYGTIVTHRLPHHALHHQVD